MVFVRYAQAGYPHNDSYEDVVVSKTNEKGNPAYFGNGAGRKND